jgi:hypothetical protein
VLANAVQLAPFGTYAVEDYGSDELRAIATFDAALEAVAPGAGDGEEPEPGQFIDEGCEAMNPVAEMTPDDARGTTFVGTYIAEERLSSPQLQDRRVYWSVERVYAGGPLPEILTVRTTACTGPELIPGVRYLFSTAAISRPDQRDSIAWRLLKEDRVRIAPFGSPVDNYPDELEYRTFQEALAAVAPDAGEGETPIRAADRLPG